MRQKYLVSVLFASATLALAQMPGSPGQQPGPTFPSQQPMPGTSPGINNGSMQQMEHQVDDRKFARDAAIGALTDVELGKLAAQKASSEAVKQFGQKMADEQNKVNEELKTVAGQESVKIPDSLDSHQRSRIDKLSKLSGAAFDKQFVKEELKDHQRDVDAFQQEARYGTDQRLKNFAAKSLPDLQQDLATTRNLKKETEARD